jgi:hypothetical protein
LPWTRLYCISRAAWRAVETLPAEGGVITEEAGGAKRDTIGYISCSAGSRPRPPLRSHFTLQCGFGTARLMGDGIPLVRYAPRPVERRITFGRCGHMSSRQEWSIKVIRPLTACGLLRIAIAGGRGFDREGETR